MQSLSNTRNNDPSVRPCGATLLGNMQSTQTSRRASNVMMICWGLEKSDRHGSTNEWASDVVEDEESPVLNGELLVASNATWKASGKVRR